MNVSIHRKQFCMALNSYNEITNKIKRTNFDYVHSGQFQKSRRRNLYIKNITGPGF